MIEFVKGRLIEKSLGHAVIECAGVGYGMDISLTTYEALPELNEETSLFTMLFVKEDAFRLFGFATTTEREIFKVLINASGVGPKLSLTILSNMPISEFGKAIAMRDFKKLTTIPAIGKKTAERLCLELKGKLDGFLGSEPGQKAGTAPPLDQGPVEDAAAALTALGVKPNAARAAAIKARQLLGDAASVEELIKEGLKYR